MNNNHLQIKFESIGHQVEISTITGTLINYEKLVKKIYQLGNKEKHHITLKIEAIQKGSFILNFVITGVGIIASIASIISLIIQLYQMNKGRQINEDHDPSIKIINQTIIENNLYIDLRTIINIYNNESIRKSIDKILESANKDESVTGVVFSDNKNDSQARISRSQFFINNDNPVFRHQSIENTKQRLQSQDISYKNLSIKDTSGFIEHRGKIYQVNSIEDLKEIIKKIGN